MSKIVVIDANVWIKLARSAGLRPLIDRFSKCNLTPVLNNYLLGEIFKAIINNKWATEKQAFALIGYIKSISIFVTESAIYCISPDPQRQLSLRPCGAV